MCVILTKVKARKKYRKKIYQKNKTKMWKGEELAAKRNKQRQERDGKTGAKEMASILDGKQKLLGSSINK